MGYAVMMKYFVAALIAPFFWLVVLSVSLWLVRRFLPRAEPILFADPITGLHRLWQAIRAALRRRS